MDIELKTETNEPKLIFLDCIKYEDNAGYGFTVFVNSSGFSAKVFCGIDNWSMEQFIAQLEACDSTVSGKATITPQFEDWYITLDVQVNGQVCVYGTLYQSVQKMHFEFITDQTCIAPLILDIKSLG